MKTILHFVCIIMLPFIGISSPIDGNQLLTKNKTVLSFAENKGQIWDFNGIRRPEVKFSVDQGNLKIFLLSTGIAYQFSRTHYPDGYLNEIHKKDRRANLAELAKEIRLETFRTNMVLVGANAEARITTEGKSTDYDNYYNRNVIDVHSFDRVTYHDVYPGIDWVIYSEGDKMKYDFIVHPGADPSLIRMQYQYQEAITLNVDGSLTLKTSMGTISEHAPVSFQGDKKIKTAFELKNNIMSFILGSYDKEQTLRIDPLLVWGTYYGGSSTDYGRSVATDASGNVYLCGMTDSQNNIAFNGHNNTPVTAPQAFLVKFNSSGVRQWGTYYGGGLSMHCNSVATDLSGNVFIAGSSQPNPDIVSGGHQNTHGGGISDAFLVKFSGTGTRLWGTFYGGSSVDDGYGCATDGSGNVYLTGSTQSSNNISSGGHQNTPGNGGDAFLVKFDASGVRLWGTYYGGGSSDLGWSCATSPAGEVFLSGFTNSSSQIASGGFQNTHGGMTDAMLAKFNASGTLQWATYYGDKDPDIGYDCAADGLGNIYLVGSTQSSINISSGGHQNTYNYADGFIVKFNNSGSRLWASYYGGQGLEDITSCAVDSNNDLYFAGDATSLTDIASGGIQNTWNGQYDGFFVKMTSNGVRVWASYYGGTQSDFAWGCALSSSGDLYVCGDVESTGVSGLTGHQNTYGGGNMDAFLIKVSTCSPPAAPPAIAGNTVVCPGIGQNYSVSPVADAVSYQWTFPSNWTGTSTSNSITLVAGVNAGGIITVVATGTCGSSSPAMLDVSVTPVPQISILSSSPVYCTGMTVTLTASGAATYTWSNGGTAPSIVVSPLTPETYTVTGRANGCNSTQTFAIVPDMTAAFNYTVSGMVASFHLVNGNCSSFTWDFGNGTSSTVNSDPITTYATAGTYAACLKCAGLPNGCTKCITITVPGNMIGGVGISELNTEAAFQIYPNPATEKFVIETAEVIAVTIYNALGEQVLQKKLSAGKNTIDLGGKAEGIYFIKADADKYMKTVVLTR